MKTKRISAAEGCSWQPVLVATRARADRLRRATASRRLGIYGWLVVCLALLASLPASYAQIVYDDTTTYLGSYYGARDELGRPTEFGDEIVLAGTQRIVNQFAFEYYGDFTPNGTQTARIRFYKNDGPQHIAAPQTLLYDSGPFAITTNFQSIVLQVPNVRVPDDFTWTIAFAGVQQVGGDQAGLLFYDPPTIGGVILGLNGVWLVGSQPDFWKRLASGAWGLYWFAHNPNANFGCRVVAAPEVLALNPSPATTNSPVRLRWSGIYQAAYLIESSEDLRTWRWLAVAHTDDQGRAHLDDTSAGSAPQRFYRAVRLAGLDEGVRLTLQPGSSNAPVRVQGQGNPLNLYQLQASDDLRAWTNLTQFRTADDGRLDYADANWPGHPHRFYRAIRVTAGAERPSLSAKLDTTSGQLRIQWQGNPNFVYPLEGSNDLVTWDFVAMVPADASGAAQYVTGGASPPPYRFYRLLVY